MGVIIATWTLIFFTDTFKDEYLLFFPLFNILTMPYLGRVQMRGGGTAPINDNTHDYDRA